MRCIAHRGFAAVNPENTVPAVVAAAGVGADCVEVDVRRCRTGEVVVCHDETVNRMTDASGPVADLSRSELDSLDVLGSGAGIPTLASVLDALPPGVDLNVELKERGLAADVIDRCRGARRDVLLSSFDPEVLAEAAGSLDYPPLALLVADEALDVPGGVAANADALAVADSLDCDAIHPHHDLCGGGFVSRAHERDLRVNAWTVRDVETAIRLRDANVDGLIADDPTCCLRGSPGSGGA